MFIKFEPGWKEERTDGKQCPRQQTPSNKATNKTEIKTIGTLK